MPPFTPEQQRRFLRSLLLETIGLLIRDILRFYLDEVRKTFRQTVLARHRRLYATEDEEDDDDNEEDSHTEEENTPSANPRNSLNLPHRAGFDEVDTSNGASV